MTILGLMPLILEANARGFSFVTTENRNNPLSSSNISVIHLSNVYLRHYSLFFLKESR